MISRLTVNETALVLVAVMQMGVHGELLGVDADHVAFGEYNLEILNNGAVGRQPEFNVQIFESIIVYGCNTQWRWC
jgi:hypothetical protein